MIFKLRKIKETNVRFECNVLTEVCNKKAWLEDKNKAHRHAEDVWAGL